MVVGNEPPANIGFRGTRRIGVDDRYDSSTLTQNYAALSEEWQAKWFVAARGGEAASDYLGRRGRHPSPHPENLDAAALDLHSQLSGALRQES
jgi:hypothetical protein